MGHGFGIYDNINIDVDLNAMKICSLAHTKISIYSCITILKYYLKPLVCVSTYK